MATINITNTSIQYTGEAFQGNVTFDLNATDTEVKLDVAFKVNLAAQLNFKSINYNSNELQDWSKKQLNSLSETRISGILGQIAERDSMIEYKVEIQTEFFDFYDADALDRFVAIVGTERFYQELVNLLWIRIKDEKAQLFDLAVIYPSGQNTSTHMIEFSVPKNSLLNESLQELSQESQEEFLAITGYKMDLWLSAELELSSGHTEGQFQYNVG